MTKNQFIKICSSNNFWKGLKRNSIVEYENIIDKKNFLTSIYKKIHDRTYYPSPAKLYLSLNKGNGVLRIVPALRLEDLVVYYYCVRILENYIALNHTPGTYGGYGLSGKLRKMEDKEIENIKDQHEIIIYKGTHYAFTEIGGYMALSNLNPKAWGAEWGDFNDKLYFSSGEFKNGVVAETDISNFYDSISLDNLEFKIRRHIPNKFNEEIYLLFHFLRFWNRHVNFYRQQGVGLPQDIFGECSRILANNYLQDYDRKIHDFCTKKGAKYFRYADDQVFFAKSKNDLEEIVSKASSFLMREGLNFNQKKVNIMSPSTFRKYYCFNNFMKLSSKKKISSSLLDTQINFYFRNKSSLRKKGFSLLIRIIRVILQTKLRPKNLKQLKKYILSEEFHSGYFLNYKELQSLYDLLNYREKAKFINLLNGKIDYCFYTYYLYNLRWFYKKNKIKYLKMINSRLTWLKHFYDFERAYIPK